MKDTEEYKGLVEQVYCQILTLLYNRGMAGAEALNAGSLAESLGVSRTPVNMALMRLGSEGLIRKNAGKGWVTIPMTLQDIEEIFDLKDLLEPLVARRAVERITTEAAAELMSVMEDMERASETQDLETWLAADHRYHDLLFNMAGNERLKQFETQLNSQLYRLWAGHSAMEGQMAKSCIEHRTVAEAVVSRQPDLAAESTLKHVRSLRASLVDVMKNVLIPFLGQEL